MLLYGSLWACCDHQFTIEPQSSDEAMTFLTPRWKRVYTTGRYGNHLFIGTTNILVAVDRSPVSLRAAQVAARLFSDRAGTDFFVVNVARLPAPWVAGAPFGLVGPMVVEPTTFEAGRDAERIEHQLLETAVAAGMDDAEPVVRVGDPVTEICRAAQTVGADVIVVGAHEKSALRRIFDPSVADGLVHATQVPVLVVHGDERL